MEKRREEGEGLGFANGGTHPPPPGGVGGTGDSIGGVGGYGAGAAVRVGAGSNHLHQTNVLPPPPLNPPALKEDTTDGGKKQTGEKDSSACIVVNQQESVAGEWEGKGEEDILLVVDETLDKKVNEDEEKLGGEKK